MPARPRCGVTSVSDAVPDAVPDVVAEAPTDAPPPGVRAALRRYRGLLRRPGVAGVLAFSVVGRLHESMIAFGLLLLVTQRSTYAAAGVALACFGVGGMVGGPVNATLAARFGHARVLLILAVAYAVGVGGMASAGPDLRWLAPVSVLAGLATPPLTPALRSTLPRLVPPAERLTVFALESTLQEVVFVAGPVLAGALAVVLAPEAVLATAAALTLAGVGGYCAVVSRHARGAPEAPPVAAASRAHRSAGPWSATTARLLVGGVAFLAVLSVASVVIVAEVSGPQAKGSAGLFLGVVSVGSMVGGLVFGARVTSTAAVAPRFAVLGGGLLALAAVAALPTSPGWAWTGAVLMLVAAFGYGTTIAPVGTVLFAELDRVAATRSTQAFGWMGAAMGLGGAIGDASGGWLVTEPGTVVAAAVGAAGAGGAALVLRGRRSRTEPDA